MAQVTVANDSTTLEALGIDKAVPAGFALCNETVDGAFIATLNAYHETCLQVALVYAGTRLDP
ncbi:hypothetical protein OG21DRAFT_1512937 [Imleria badia]|nr:hypothetical protein OG21DRAFT_1512937 [Imleria badia]